jgi:hypothetical protein
MGVSGEMHPISSLEELFGSLKPDRPIASPREEKQAAREAIAREAASEGLEAPVVQ